MALKVRNKILLAKSEVTYGTDPVPTGAANAVLTRSLELTAIEAEEVERELLRGTPGNNPKLLAGVHCALTFQVEIQGAGAAGTAPGYGAILKGCAHSETISAGVDVQYTPVNTNEGSTTFYVYHDGILHKITGARGSVKYTFAVGGIPVMEFTFIGLYNAPIAQANPTGTFTAFKAPKVVSNALGTFSLGGFAAKLETFELDVAVERTYHELIGAKSIEVTDRKPAGTLTIEEPTLATKDYWAEVLAENELAVSMQHGNVAGSIVSITAQKLQLGKPSRTEKNGVSMLQIPFTVNDDYILKVA
ncbi:hypothetical protein HPT27_10595 [Permianibacter sp. IMCC34836]|uniref:phage tail tube protein n=1 Tax=Permianibacter fluminis TaxID=2738515 RepID=UPI001556A7D3|nr:phage tail tube protein [Permianibacter fluminis]NQD37476.1 hypothetical protein [Permianibacter fluminis]